MAGVATGRTGFFGSMEIKGRAVQAQGDCGKAGQPVAGCSAKAGRGARCGGSALEKLPVTRERLVKGSASGGQIENARIEPQDERGRDRNFDAMIWQCAIRRRGAVFGVVVVVGGRSGLGGVGIGEEIKRRLKRQPAKNEDNQPADDEHWRRDGSEPFHARDNTNTGGKFKGEFCGLVSFKPMRRDLCH
jgi:hypothetical protein